MPLAEIDLFEVLVAFYNSDDEELKDNARQTLATQDTEMLRETLLSANIARRYWRTSSIAVFAVRRLRNDNRKSANAWEAIANFARNTTSGELLDVFRSISSC